jgi:hypothetical protein
MSTPANRVAGRSVIQQICYVFVPAKCIDFMFGANEICLASVRCLDASGALSGTESQISAVLRCCARRLPHQHVGVDGRAMSRS